VWPPLWSNGQSSWLQIQRSGFDSRSYQIFWELVGLERGPLSLVSTIEELLGRKNCGSGLENRDYGRRDPSSFLRGTLYPQNLALTSPTSGYLSVGIVRSRTQVTEFMEAGAFVFECIMLCKFRSCPFTLHSETFQVPWNVAEAGWTIWVAAACDRRSRGLEQAVQTSARTPYRVKV
jgi:hypothetical protein